MAWIEKTQAAKTFKAIKNAMVKKAENTMASGTSKKGKETGTSS